MAPTLSICDQSVTSGMKPLTVTVSATCAITGLGATKIWQLIKDGRLDAVRIDGRTLVKFASVERLLSPAPDDQPAPRETPRPKRGRPRKQALRPQGAAR